MNSILKRAAGAAAVCFVLALRVSAQCAVEGRVELPKALHAPVMNKRYGIVSFGGVLAPYPPVAIVYLEGTFPKPATPATARMAQKDLNFFPALLPVQVGTRVEFPNQDDIPGHEQRMGWRRTDRLHRVRGRGVHVGKRDEPRLGASGDTCRRGLHGPDLRLGG